MFIEQAWKGDNTPWKVWLTTLLATGIFLLNFVVFIFTSPDDIKQMYDQLKDWPNNTVLIVELLPFAFLLGLLFLLVFFIHNRSPLSLTTARKKIDFGRFFFSFSLIVAFSVASFVFSYYMDSSDIVWNFNPFRFSILVVISLVLFPFQIGFEEYLFRGFLMQQIGVAARNRWLPLAITSILFGVFHSANPEVAEMGYGIMGFYIGTGLLLGIMVLMDDGLELSLGFHLGNNLMAAVLVSSDFSALQTDALFRYTGSESSSGMLVETLVSICIMYPLLLFILAKKYKWKDWREKLTGKVYKTEVKPQTSNHDTANL
jgi:membrane protease YdiL (CAAX protease family)